MVYDCTTDNTGNITNAIVDHFHLVQLSCVGHTLQLKGLKVQQVAHVLGRCKELVKHIFMNLHKQLMLQEKNKSYSLMITCPELSNKIAIHLPDAEMN